MEVGGGEDLIDLIDDDDDGEVDIGGDLIAGASTPASASGNPGGKDEDDLELDSGLL